MRAVPCVASHLHTLQHRFSALCLIHARTEVHVFQQFKAGLDSETQRCVWKLGSAPYVNTRWQDTAPNNAEGTHAFSI